LSVDNYLRDAGACPVNIFNQFAHHLIVSASNSWFSKS